MVRLSSNPNSAVGKAQAARGITAATVGTKSTTTKTTSTSGSSNTGKTKQQVLDEAVASGGAKVSSSGQISVGGKVIGSTSEFEGTDMSRVQDPTTGKFYKQAPIQLEEPLPEPQPQETDAGATTTAQQASGGQEKQNAESTQKQQTVGGMTVGASGTGGTQTKEDVLDRAISSGQATVDQSGNVITKSGQNLGNITGMDLTKSTIGQTAPNANQAVQQDQQALQQQKQDDLNKINNIKPDVSLGLSNSPDSPFWNKFGQEAIDTESQVPGYMNERNKTIASSIMLNNQNIKFMSDAKRKDVILRDIIDRQEGGIDPAIESWYTRTIDNINNLINREIPAYKSEDYFNMLLKGEKIDYDAAEGNPELKSARERFNNLQKFSSMDVSSLSQAIDNGELLKGGQTWTDLLNKGMGDALNRAYSMYTTKSETSVYNYVEGELFSFDTNLALEGQKSQPLDLGTGLELKISEKILSLMTDDKIPTLASFLAADEDVQRAKETARETESQINNLSTEIENFADDVKTKVVEKGGEATDDPFLNAYIQEKTKPFVRRLTQLQSKYRNEIALLSDLSENARTEFEVKEYNKQAEIQGYQFLLSRLDKQQAEEAAVQQAAQEQKRWELEFGFKQNQADQQQQNREKNYKLDLAKYNLSRSGSSSSSPDILNRLWSGTAGIKDLLSDKQLAISGMTGMEKTQAIQSAGAGMMYTKSKDDPTQAMKRRSEVLKSSSAYNTENFVKPATAIYGANKTYSYLLDNDITNIQNDPEISQEESYDQIAEMLSLTFGDAEVDRMLLFAGLKDRLGSSQHANEILDRLDMETYGWLDSRRINVQK